MRRKCRVRHPTVPMIPTPSKLNQYPDRQVREFWGAAMLVGLSILGAGLILVGACLGVGKLIEVVVR